MQQAYEDPGFCISPGSEEELWDLVDGQGNKTGRLHRRGVPLAPGERHLCVHVWVQDPSGQFLITRRHEAKRMGGLWECTGGCVLAGESSREAALREVAEETGLRLQPENGRVLLRYSGSYFVCDVWLFRQDFDPARLTLQPGETTAARAASADAIRALAQEDAFTPLPYLERVLALG